MIKGTALPIVALAGILYLSLQTSFDHQSTTRQKLGPAINSEYQEVRPLISPDGNTLYFCRRNHPENIGGVNDFQDIWISHFVNGQWSVPTNLGEPINNSKANTLCSIAEDGKFGVFLDSYRKVKTPLAWSKLTPDGWQKPKEIEIRDFVNQSSYYDFFHYESLGILLMAINSGRGSGDQDLHISFLQDDGTYSIPVNLGQTVNSRKADFAPFLAADRKTLYFSSFGHDGHGGSDLYVTQRLDNSWKKWSPPLNLGPGINSPDDENYISVTGNFENVYFESYPQGSKEKDIYQARLPERFRPQNLLNPEEQPPNQLVTDAARVEVSKMAAEKPSSASDTQHQLPAPNSSPVSDLPSNETPGSSNLAIKDYLDQGTIKSKVLNNLYFSSNNYQLPHANRANLEKLDEISRMLISKPTTEAYFEGHTDNRGPVEVNLRISYLRAQSAAHYLIDKGIPGSRLQINGSGEAKPLASNDDEKDGRELNRRVEITLVDAAGAYQVFILR